MTTTSTNVSNLYTTKDQFTAIVPCRDCDGSGRVSSEYRRNYCDTVACSECEGEGVSEVNYDLCDIDSAEKFLYIEPAYRIKALNALSVEYYNDAILYVKEAVQEILEEASGTKSIVERTAMEKEAKRLQNWYELNEGLRKTLQLTNTVYRQAAELVRTSISLEDAYSKLMARIVKP